MNKETVLVIMPIYNAEKTLANAIESILNQTYKNLKLILVDDCSSDNSLNIAKSYLSDRRVAVYHNNQNMGAYYSRNVGLYVNSGKPWGYFTTHDSDDVSYKNRMFNLIKLLRNGRANGVQDVFERKDFYTKQTLSKSLTIAHAVFKRPVFDTMGYFEVVRFGADWEHWARVTEYNRRNGGTTISCNQPGGESYVHENNLTVQIPLTSPKRKKYIFSSRSMHRSMAVANNFYRPFSIDLSITEECI